MTYVEGFVTPVPMAARDAYIAHAGRAVDCLREYGVTRLVETWADDVPDGILTDFRRAVAALPEEAVLFSWMEFPDKATRDAGMMRMADDPRMAAMAADMPFDSRRMIHGGFDALLDTGGAGDDGAGPIGPAGPTGPTGYIDGFLVPVPHANRDAYTIMARGAAAVFREHGAIRVVEAWGDDVPAGKVTDHARAVQATADETVVYSWVEWPSKAVRDAGVAAVMADDRMRTPPADMPFDGRRMIFGGFVPILDR